MGIFDSVEGIAKREMTIFFLIDTSGSMSGTKIGTVNTTMEEIIPEIADFSGSNADAFIRCAVLKFSNGCSWTTSEPIPIEQFRWDYLDAFGYTEMGAAMIELNSKLSRSAFMNSSTGSFAPVIILLSDGEPTDDYRSGLAVLKNNSWFKNAVKAAIAIGKDANTDMLAEFTDVPGNVVRVHTPEDLKNWIKFVTMTASKIGSTSSTAATSKNEQLGQAMEIEAGGFDPADTDEVIDLTADTGNGTIEIKLDDTIDDDFVW